MVKRYCIGACLGILLSTAPAALADNTTSSDPSLSGWRALEVRSEEEYRQGMTGGEAEQHCQGIARSRSNPDIIYLSHDCGQVWRSGDSGATWRKPLCKGLFALAGQSIEVDPVNPVVVLAIMDNGWDWMNESFQGLYRSADGGDTWRFVLPVRSEIGNSRRYEHNLAWDGASISGGCARRWYAAISNDWLYRSEDGGVLWAKAAALSGFGRVYGVQTHPQDSRTLFIASAKGLLVSRDRGATLAPAGNLPGGEVSSLAFDEKNRAVMYAVLKGQGLYRSSDSGAAFELIKKYPAEHVFINSGHPLILYLTGQEDSLYSADGGMTWETVSLMPAQGLGREYKTRMQDALTGIAPNPSDPREALPSPWRLYGKPQTAYILKTARHGSRGTTAAGGMALFGFDLKNPERFALFNEDVGMSITENGGAFFFRRGVPKSWRDGPFKKIPWTSMHGAGLQPGTKIIVSAAGDTWEKKLVRSEDSGLSWEIVDDELRNNLFVAVHPVKTSVVYADNKISSNGGKSFQKIEWLAARDAVMLGMCQARPDTVYAMNKERTVLYRSDDAAATWREYAAPGWPFALHDAKPAFAVDPVDNNKTYTLDVRGDLAVYEGKAWRSLGLLNRAAGADGPKNIVRAVAIDNRHPEIVYAGMHAPGFSTLWRSIDAGMTWQDMTLNLPRLSVSSIVINPHSGEVMVGGCCGTWVLPPPYESRNGLYGKLLP